MNICVYCSAAEVGEKYTKPVQELGAMIARGGHSLVWGGSNNGMMKTIADAVQENGGDVIGVSFELLRDQARENATIMIVEKDLATRRTTMLERADAFIMLPGGTGTLDEVTEVIALKTFELHDKAIVALNTDSFFEGFKMQLERMNSEGFLHRPLSDLIHFADTPKDVMSYIEEYIPPAKPGKF